jgi:hypothetical protein
VANLPPLSGALGFTYPNFDQGLGRAKKGVDFTRETYVLGTLSPDGFIFGIPTIGASVANTTVQGYYVLPTRTKIAKLSVFCSAISSVAGTISFNIVLGTGAYTQGNVPGNDNSSVPDISYNQSGQAVGSGTSGATPAGGAGICQNPALPGQAMFAADVIFNVANFPNLTTGTGTGANYAQSIVPSSPDAVWPNMGVLTLRVTTPAGASITNLYIGATLEPQPLSATFPAVGSGTLGVPPEPSYDF